MTVVRCTARRAWGGGISAALVVLFAQSLHGETKAADGDCNAFFPVPRGARWVYVDGSPPTLRRTVTVESEQTVAGVTTAELRQVVDGAGAGGGGGGAGDAMGSASTTVRCDASGVSLLVRGSAGGKESGLPKGEVRAKLPGLPPAKDLSPGYSWRSESEIDTSEGTSHMVSRGIRGSRVEAIVPVRVPAGDFAKAIKVVAVENLTVQVAGGEHKARQETIEWYVRGVGLVKRETRIRRGEQATAISVESLESYSGLKPHDGA
jgi:hypothetical protein